VSGFVKIRRGILDHLLSGIISIFEFGIYVILHLQADYRTGVWTGSAPRLRAAAPRGARMRDLQRALQRLGEIGFIRIFRTPGKRGNYYVLIHKYESTDAALKGKRLNAFQSPSWQELVFEFCTDDDTDGADSDTDTALEEATDRAPRDGRLNGSKSSGCEKPVRGVCAENATDDDTDARTDAARYQEEEQEREKEKGSLMQFSQDQQASELQERVPNSLLDETRKTARSKSIAPEEMTPSEREQRRLFLHKQAEEVKAKFASGNLEKKSNA
jgi:hypothetical protein